MNEEQTRATIESAISQATRDATGILGHDGLKIERCGDWLWLSHPQTREFRKALAATGWRWSKTKSRWYFAAVHSTGRGRYSYGDIALKYGREEVAV